MPNDTGSIQIVAVHTHASLLLHYCTSSTDNQMSCTFSDPVLFITVMCQMTGKQSVMMASAHRDPVNIADRQQCTYYCPGLGAIQVLRNAFFGMCKTNLI